MATVIDSTNWPNNGWTSPQLASALEDFLERLDRAFEARETVWVGDDLQTQIVYNELDLWSLRDPGSPLKIDDNIWQELAAALGQTQRYVDENDWPPGFDDFTISVNGGVPTLNPDVAWAHHSVISGTAVACLGLTLKGVFPTTSARGTLSLHWTGDAKSCSLFWREAIDVERDSPGTLERLAPYAYPGLYFPSGVWHGLGNFNGGYYANSVELRRYLGILSDDGAWAFTSPPPAQVRTEAQGTGNEKPPSHLIIQRFARLALNVTPENPDVYRDRTCRTAREVEVLGENLYFGWHGKLQLHQNRVHVHPPTGGTQGKMIVGIFHEHLPLP